LSYVYIYWLRLNTAVIFSAGFQAIISFFLLSTPLEHILI